MRVPRSIVVAVLGFILAACAGETTAPPLVPPPAPTPAAPTAVSVAPAPANPFLEARALPYHAPAFDRIHDGDYEPAIEEGITEHLAEIAKITTQADAPTFENTIVAMERSGQLLDRVTNVFFGMTGANTNDALQAIEKRVAPKLAAHHDAIYLDPKLWERVKAVYERRDALDPDAKYLSERYRRDFVRAGAELSEADKTQLRSLNEEESSLETDFTQRLLAATKS